MCLYRADFRAEIQFSVVHTYTVFHVEFGDDPWSRSMILCQPAAKTDCLSYYVRKIQNYTVRTQQRHRQTADDLS